MKAGTAFAFAASQPSASDVRFVLRAAIDIAASCRADLSRQVESQAESEPHTEGTKDTKETGQFISPIVVTFVFFVRNPLGTLNEVRV